MTLMRVIFGFMASLVGLLVVLPLCVVGFPFWLVSLLTRKLAPVFEPQSVTWEKVITFDEKFGWRAKPNLNVYCEAAPHVVFQVSTDAHGWRGKGSIEDSEVLVFGDSYAWGYGVHDHEFFADLNPSLKIKSIGVPGYSMVHALMWMQEYAEHLGRKLVVWLPFAGNDFFDNVLPNYLHYRMPFVRPINGEGQWEIVTEHVVRAAWPFNHEKNMRQREKYLGTFGRNTLSDRVYSACEFLIREASDLCRNAGGRLVIVNVPTVHQLSDAAWARHVKSVGLNGNLDRRLPDQKVEAICQKIGVPCISLSRIVTPDDHIPQEGHWNAKGHRRIAELLAQLHTDFCHGRQTGNMARGGKSSS